MDFWIATAVFVSSYAGVGVISMRHDRACLLEAVPDAPPFTLFQKVAVGTLWPFFRTLEMFAYIYAMLQR